MADKMYGIHIYLRLIYRRTIIFAGIRYGSNAWNLAVSDVSYSGLSKTWNTSLKFNTGIEKYSFVDVHNLAHEFVFRKKNKVDYIGTEIFYFFEKFIKEKIKSLKQKLKVLVSYEMWNPAEKVVDGK